VHPTAIVHAPQRGNSTTRFPMGDLMILSAGSGHIGHPYVHVPVPVPARSLRPQERFAPILWMRFPR